MLARWLVRLRALLRRDEVESEFDEELRYHLDRETERNEARGMSPREARRAAHRAFGDPGRLKEEARETWRWRGLDELVQDLGYSGRGLRRSPAFAFVAVLSLGFGIGATSTLFGVIDALDFRPLPYPRPDRLVWLAELLPQDSERCPGCPWYVPLSTAAAWQARAHSFEAVATWWRSGAYLPDGGASRSLSVGQASPGFFDILGARPRLGRTFLPEDTVPGAEPVTVLSYTTWQREFGGDPRVVGKRLAYFRDMTLTESRAATVVGVLPDGFRFDQQVHAFWIPLSAGRDGDASPDGTYGDVLARLKPGIARDQAEEELRAVARGLHAQDSDPFQDVTIRPLRERLGMGTGEGRGVLFAITGLVLLIAVMNVAGLSLARAVSRRRELTLRAALGARRGRLVRQLLVEGTLLGVMGGAAGVLVSGWGMAAARTWFQLGNAATSTELDHRIVLFSAGASLLVGILTALLPILHLGRGDVHMSLRQRPGSGSSSRVGGVTATLLAAQVAAGLMLVTGAGLLGSEFLEVRYLDTGLDPAGLYEGYLFGFDDPALLESPEGWRPQLEDVDARARRIRGVSGVALRHWSARSPAVVRPDGPGAASLDEHTPTVRAVTRGYFQTLGTPILRGRGFTDSDRKGARSVAVLNRAAAARFWPGADPLGRAVFVGDSTGAGEWLTVVGVVADVETGAMVERHWSVVYRPLAQAPIYHAAASLFVRVPSRAQATLQGVQMAVREALGHPTSTLRSVEDELGARYVTERFNALALNLFAAFALLLASMGIYGSVAYQVARRTREIGIRVALGAKKGRVLRLVARHAAGVAAAGILVGLGGSILLVRVLGVFVSATRVGGDPWMFAASAAVVGGVALLATWIPARRATAVDPVVALRSD